MVHMTAAHADLFAQLADALDPHPVLHRLRREDPVHFVASHDFWFVTRYEHVMQLLHDPDNVTPDGRVAAAYVPPPAGSFLRWMHDHGILTLAPAEHSRLRKLASPAFGVRAIHRMTAQIDDVVSRAAAPIAQHTGAVIDLSAAFVNVIPVAVISRITGIRPGDDQARFTRLVEAVVAGALPFADDDRIQTAELSFAELATWIRGELIARRANPADDLLSDLASASVDGVALTEDDAVLLLCSIITAGVVTVAGSAAAVLRVALDHPEVMHALRGDRHFAQRVLDELLRFAAGAAGPVRFATRPFTLGDKHIAKGEMLMLSFGGACRDPAVYQAPDTLQLERDTGALPIFGRGPHYCLGATLARHELASMLVGAAGALPPGSRICEDRLELGHKGVFLRPTNLPVQLAR